MDIQVKPKSSSLKLRRGESILRMKIISDMSDKGGKLMSSVGKTLGE